MIRTMLQAKLHRARVTHACLDYEGSCGIDRELLDLSGMKPNQFIELYNVTNGERFSTYIIEEPRGSGHISLNGAAARRVQIGDILIICTYAGYDEVELRDHKPVVVLIGEGNRAQGPVSRIAS